MTSTGLEEICSLELLGENEWKKENLDKVFFVFDVF